MDPSWAHLNPEQLRHVRGPQFGDLIGALAAQFVREERSGSLRDGAAATTKGNVRDHASVVQLQLHRDQVAAARVAAINADARLLECTKVVRRTVMLKDLLSIKIVNTAHSSRSYRSKIFRASRSPSKRASRSSSVVYGATLTRAVAESSSCS